MIPAQAKSSGKQYYFCDVATGARDSTTDDPAGFDQVLDLVEYNSVARIVNVFKGTKGQDDKITFADEPIVYRYDTDAARKDFGSRLDFNLDGKWEYGFFTNGQYSLFSPALSFDVTVKIHGDEINRALENNMGLPDFNGDGIPDEFRGTTGGKGILSIDKIPSRPKALLAAKDGKAAAISYE